MAQNFRDGVFIKPIYKYPHLAFSEGKLYRFSPTKIQVLNLTRGVASRKTALKPHWENFIPENLWPFLFSMPKSHQLKHEKFGEYYQRRYQLAKKIRTFLTRAYNRDVVYSLNRYSSRHWWVLSFLRLTQYTGAELMQSNPSLCYLICSSPIFRPLKSKQYNRSISSVAKKTQKGICLFYNFDEYFANVSKKIIPISLDVNMLWGFKYALREQAFKRRISFIKNLHKGNISIMFSNDLLWLCSDSLLNEVGNSRRELKVPETFYSLRDIIRMKNQIIARGGKVPNWGKGYFNSVGKVEEIYHDSILKIASPLYDSVKDQLYPESGLSDISSDWVGIHQIRTRLELQKHGVKMKHCIYQYDQECHFGERYVAEMLKPENVTILFCKNDAGKYELKDARGKQNKRAEPYVLNIIKAWLGDEELFRYNPKQIKLFEDEFHAFDDVPF